MQRGKDSLRRRLQYVIHGARGYRGITNRKNLNTYNSPATRTRHTWIQCWVLSKMRGKSACPVTSRKRLQPVQNCICTCLFFIEICETRRIRRCHPGTLGVRAALLMWVPRGRCQLSVPQCQRRQPCQVGRQQGSSSRQSSSSSSSSSLLGSDADAMKHRGQAAIA